MIYGKEVNMQEAKSLISQIQKSPNYFEEAIGGANDSDGIVDIFELPDGSLVETISPSEARTAKVVKARKDGDGNLQKVI